MNRHLNSTDTVQQLNLENVDESRIIPQSDHLATGHLKRMVQIRGQDHSKGRGILPSGFKISNYKKEQTNNSNEIL